MTETNQKRYTLNANFFTSTFEQHGIAPLAVKLRNVFTIPDFSETNRFMQMYADCIFRKD